MKFLSYLALFLTLRCAPSFAESVVGSIDIKNMHDNDYKISIVLKNNSSDDFIFRINFGAINILCGADVINFAHKNITFPSSFNGQGIDSLGKLEKKMWGYREYSVRLKEKISDKCRYSINVDLNKAKKNTEIDLSEIGEQKRLEIFSSSSKEILDFNKSERISGISYLEKNHDVESRNGNSDYFLRVGIRDDSIEKKFILVKNSFLECASDKLVGKSKYLLQSASDDYQFGDFGYVSFMVRIGTGDSNCVVSIAYSTEKTSSGSYQVIRMAAKKTGLYVLNADF